MPPSSMTSQDTASRVLTQLTALDALFVALRGVVERHDSDRRKLLIQYRRNLAQQIGDLSAATAMFVPSSGENDLRRRLSAVRYQIALHQAEWPAVTIEDSSAYRSSALRVLATYEDFSRWLRDEIATLLSTAG